MPIRLKDDWPEFIGGDAYDTDRLALTRLLTKSHLARHHLETRLRFYRALCWAMGLALGFLALWLLFSM